MRRDLSGTSGGASVPIDARLALLMTLGFVALVVATPLGRWRWIAAEGLVLAFVVGLAGIDPRALLRRWLALLLLVAFLAVLLAQNHPLRAELGRAGLVAAIVARNCWLGEGWASGLPLRRRAVGSSSNVWLMDSPGQGMNGTRSAHPACVQRLRRFGGRDSQFDEPRPGGRVRRIELA